MLDKKKIEKKVVLSFPTIGKAEFAAVGRVLMSKHLERGPETKKLENKAKKIFGVRHAVATSNATGGLLATLKSCGIGEGDEVITTPFTFAATVNAIAACGACPVYVDIEPNTFNLNFSKVKARITRRTKAILAVDLFGHPADYDLLAKLANKYNLLLIADSAQAIGAKIKVKYIGNYVDIQVFSFYGSKGLTSGEGGMVVTNKSQLAEGVNRFIGHGQNRGTRYEYKEFGLNFRPTDIQSALISSQLSRLKAINKKRRKNAETLSKLLEGIKGVQTPKEVKDFTHTFSRYVIRVTPKFRTSRENLIKELAKAGIESEIAYPKPLHYYPHLCFGFKKGSLPEAEKAASEVLSLPIHQNLVRSQLKLIAKTIAAYK